MRADPSTSGRILAVVTDLMLESRIREKARAMDYDVSVVGTVQAVRDAVDSAPPAPRLHGGEIAGDEAL